MALTMFKWEGVLLILYLIAQFNPSFQSLHDKPKLNEHLATLAHRRWSNVKHLDFGLNSKNQVDSKGPYLNDVTLA